MAGLMAAAAALFVEKGYDATTMTEIAVRAGASIGSLYLFFPTRAALAQALLTDLADGLSARLLALRERSPGWSAPWIADALFDELALFLAAHPVYAALIDLPGDHGWKHAVRARRRREIAALFAQASPALPPGQSDRLAVIVPQLMRISMMPSGEAPPSLPSGEALPSLPSCKPPPLLPSGETPPLLPSGKTSPLLPSGETSPLLPRGETSPLLPRGETSPLLPRGETSPLLPRGETSPLLPRGETSPLLPSGETSPLLPSGETPPLRTSLLDELRDMLRHHLEAGLANAGKPGTAAGGSG